MRKILLFFLLLGACDNNYVEHKVGNKESLDSGDFADAQTLKQNIRSFKAYGFTVSHNEIGISDYEGLSEILVEKDGKLLDSLIAPSGFLEIVVATEFHEDIFLKDLDADKTPNLLLKQYTGEKACCYDLININLDEKGIRKNIISGRYSEILIHSFDEESFTLHLKEGSYIDLKAMPSIFMRVEKHKQSIDTELMKTQFVAKEHLEKATKLQKEKKILAYEETLSWIYSGKAKEAYTILKEIWADDAVHFEPLWQQLKARTLEGVYAHEIRKLNRW